MLLLSVGDSTTPAASSADEKASHCSGVQLNQTSGERDTSVVRYSNNDYWSILVFI